MTSNEPSYRPVNMAEMCRYDHVKHSIPLGSLVEVDVEEYASHTHTGVQIELKGKCRLIVVEHPRDCDGTPLYTLSDIPVRSEGLTIYPPEWVRYKTFSKFWESGYRAERLKPTDKIIPLYDNLQSYFESSL